MRATWLATAKRRCRLAATPRPPRVRRAQRSISGDKMSRAESERVLCDNMCGSGGTHRCPELSSSKEWKHAISSPFCCSVSLDSGPGLVFSLPSAFAAALEPWSSPPFLFALSERHFPPTCCRERLHADAKRCDDALMGVSHSSDIARGLTSDCSTCSSASNTTTPSRRYALFFTSYMSYL